MGGANFFWGGGPKLPPRIGGALTRPTECDDFGTKMLCWVTAASGPFLENNLFPLKSGFKMGFCQWLKWVQCGFWGTKAGKNGKKNTCYPG